MRRRSFARRRSASSLVACVALSAAARLPLRAVAGGVGDLASPPGASTEVEAASKRVAASTAVALAQARAGVAARDVPDALEAWRLDGSGARWVPVPDAAPAPTATSSKFWGVNWDKRERRWQARYKDADGKKRSIGYFNTQEEAARAVNAAIRRAGLEGRRKTNPVVDGQLVPRERKTTAKKRRREESPAAAPSPRARRPRRAATYDDSEPDDDDDEDLELAPPDGEDGWA